MVLSNAAAKLIHKSYIYMLLLIGATPALWANETYFPPYIDFSRFHFSKPYASSVEDAWQLGYCAFNNAPEFIPFFEVLKQTYKIDVAVETGTFKGSTTVAFALLFDQVHTIEIAESTYQSSKEALQRYANISCYLGSSEKVLKEILPSLADKRVLFYLDAHWNEHWPLLEELAEISKTHKDNCIVVVDDFKVPNRKDIPYDAYGKHECSYEYIRSELSKIFTDYHFHFLIPKTAACRAKFVAIPKKWES